MLPNLNPVGTSSTPQVFLVFGLVNYTLWNDQGGLEKGEVDALDIGTGEWARILPAGDPGSSNPGGTPAYPSARQGAVGLTFTEALVGNSRGNATDSIVFGGVDAEGNYLSEVWILRAYNAQWTQSNQSWTNYDGQLVGGPEATGQGVTDQYMTVCASALSPKATQTTAFEPSATSTGA